MYDRILVPLDGSDTGTRGLREAIGLARANGARLHLLHVIDDYPLLLQSGSEPHHFEQMRQRLRQEGQRLLDQAQATVQAAGLGCEAVLRETASERVSQAIIDEAKDAGCELIVIGTHGRRGLDRYLLGSNAEAVARSSPVSVLLVRGDDMAA
jgi:nucleotide-binding universal stress UspA family protein